MQYYIYKIILGVIGMLIGIWRIIETIKKHKRIDSESVATVSEVRDLGRDCGKKLYSIKYIVNAIEPFDLLVYPCRKIKKAQSRSVLFYEKADPKHNYYFKSIGRFDKRFLMPCSVLFFSVFLLTVSIVNILKVSL